MHFRSRVVLQPFQYYSALSNLSTKKPRPLLAHIAPYQTVLTGGPAITLRYNYMAIQRAKSKNTDRLVAKIRRIELNNY